MSDVAHALAHPGFRWLDQQPWMTPAWRCEIEGPGGVRCTGSGHTVDEACRDALAAAEEMT